MSEFTIGEPTKMPVGEYGKWTALIARVKSMTNGTVLPLEFKDVQSATTFANGRAGDFRRRGVRVQRRQNVVYLSRLESS